MENNHNNSPLSFVSHNEDNKFSVYCAPISRTNPTGQVSLHETWQVVKNCDYGDLIQAVRKSTDEEEKKSLKATTLHYITVSGLFKRRSAKNIIRYSGIIVLDFDHVDISVKNEIFSDQFLNVALIFISPSGDGLKVFIRVNNSRQEDHSLYFDALSIYFLEKYRLKADPSGKDIARACYLSADEKALYRIIGYIESATLLGNYNPNYVTTSGSFSQSRLKNDAIRLHPPSNSLNQMQAVILRSIKAIKMVGGRTKDGVHWTRPGKDLTAGPSAKYNMDETDGTFKFTVFSSNWLPFENKGYTPVQIICLLEYDNDWDRCLKNLLLEYNHSFQSQSVLQKTQVSTRTQPPTPKESPEPLSIIKINDSEYSISFFSFYCKRHKALGSVGTYLSGINRDQFLKILSKVGYFKKYNSTTNYQYVHQLYNKIKEVGINQIRDMANHLVRQIKDIDVEFDNLNFKASNKELMEVFLRNCTSLLCDPIMGNLPNHNKPIIRDSKSEMFFPFSNRIVKVSKDDISTIEYQDLKDDSIWTDHIIDRSFTLNSEPSKYSSFIGNVMSHELARIDAARSAIGYLLHNIYDPAHSDAVVLLDEVRTKKNHANGRTGKGIFVQAIKTLRSTAIIDGKGFQEVNRFASQVVKMTTQIVVYDDVKSDFNFNSLFSKVTESFFVEYKMKHGFFVEPHPKIMITSNTALLGEGDSYEDRQFILEFSNFYSKQLKHTKNPIINSHGGRFFNSDWETDEWNRFDTFMLQCAQLYLNKGLLQYERKAFKENRLIQNTSDEFVEWINQGNVKIDQDYDVNTLFANFIQTYFDGKDHEMRQRTFSNYLNYYATAFGFSLKRRPSNGKTLIRFSQQSD